MRKTGGIPLTWAELEQRWREHAAPLIAHVLATTRGETKITDALRRAYPFGERKGLALKIWRDEIARQRGTKPKRRSPEVDPRQLKLF